MNSLEARVHSVGILREIGVKSAPFHELLKTGAIEWKSQVDERLHRPPLQTIQFTQFQGGDVVAFIAASRTDPDAAEWILLKIPTDPYKVLLQQSGPAKYLYSVNIRHIDVDELCTVPNKELANFVDYFLQFMPVMAQAPQGEEDTGL